jgi:hypothetical protein
MRILLLMVILVHPCIGRAQNAAEIAKQYWNSVVLIVTQDANRQSLAIGSGLIVENGKVVTNYHVIEGAKYAYALSASGSKYPIDGLFGTDQKNDLALLSAQGIQKSTVNLSMDSVQIGQRIYAIGNPEGLSNSISEGIVSGKRTLNGSKLIQITAPISPGSSGGPIVDDRGQVIGIAVGAITSGQNLNFAIPVALVLPMLSNTTLTALNSPVRKVISGNNSVTTNIADGLRVVDVKFDCAEYSSTGFECELKGFSINNMLEYTVKNIKVILIRTNSVGVPMDYAEVMLCDQEMRSSDLNREKCDLNDVVNIKPGLSKYYDFEWWRDGIARKTKTDKLVIRILNFEIVRE